MTANPDILEIAARMRAEDRAFCLATVVRTADLTSAKAGAKAVVTLSGDIQGHLGGACVQRAVRAAASDVLQTGSARMISVRPDTSTGTAEVDVEVHASGCPSGGTVDVFLEPFRTAERLWICGDTPIARAIEAHARLMGFAVQRMAAPEDALDQPVDFAIIASQGTGDAMGLQAALDSGAGHIAMIASRKKAEVLKERLAKTGADPSRLAAIHAPAGLDIGAIDPHEIAISVLAELVAARRRARG